MLFLVIIILAIISIVWAFWSLRQLEHDKKNFHQVKKQLSEGRVVFHRYHHSSSSASSDR
jgi:cell division protein FtsL